MLNYQSKANRKIRLFDTINYKLKTINYKLLKCTLRFSLQKNTYTTT